MWRNWTKGKHDKLQSEDLCEVLLLVFFVISQSFVGWERENEMWEKRLWNFVGKIWLDKHWVIVTDQEEVSWQGESADYEEFV
jgi:hypothetical protein